MNEKKQTPHYVTNTEALRKADEEEKLAEDVRQAIGNTEVLWDEMRKMQAEIESLKRRVADLEESASE